MASRTSDINWLTPPQIAERLAIGSDKVLTWIRNGELRAVNVAERISGRPRWRISESAFEEFLKSRESSPPPTRTDVNRRYVSRPSRPIGKGDRRLSKNIPHEVKVKRLAMLMAAGKSGQGSEWRPFVPDAVKRYAERTGVKVDESAVTALKAWWENLSD